MSIKKSLLIAVGSIILVSGCAGGIAKETDVKSLRNPTKDILITSGNINTPYIVLGPVEATLNGQSLYGTSEEKDKKITDVLKKVAYTKFDNQVDAIINCHGGQDINGGFWGSMAGAYGAPTGSINAYGIAVHYK